MSFLSVDDIAAGYGAAPGPVRFRKAGTTMQGAGIMHSLWYETGYPNAGNVPTGGINGTNQTSDPTMVTGQIPFVKAATGKNKALALFKGRSSQSGSLYLMDRLWHNNGISVTTTTTQTISGIPILRDVNGAALGTGVLAALEVSSTMGNSSTNQITMSYTNESGTSGRTATMPSFPGAAIVGTFVEFDLQAGDLGIRSVQGINLGVNLVSGGLNIILYRVLAVLQFDVANAKDTQTWDQLGLPRLYDGTVPFLTFVPDGTTAADVQGVIAYAEK